jgi:ribosomal protein S18 acetylase RimI-like enzyme
MRTEAQLKERIKEYKGVEYFYTPQGYIAWQLSTGDNYEIMFIESSEPGKGYGTELMRKFVETVTPPYHSVFVFRLASNEAAGHFYRKLGFKETLIKGLYKGDDAVLGVVSFEELKSNVKAS